ncbi:MAG TPA: HAD family hydrolase [Candidatus Limosilactobacillus merdipullorum]|uniref:HAD family hydrolase n=1 Tax=Candidatus Limosilactobacillus merdipullorum TaxID=2838653 RepID=A0A9D1U4J0_9LACO|nr:HAD family hydrolase [Candidatus Limosilactobacillus merdipullorum]
MAIKNFIFDIDGTLIDTYDVYMPTLFEVLADYGYHYTPEEEEHYSKEVFGIPGWESLEYIGNIKKDQMQEILDAWDEAAEVKQQDAKVIDGVPEMLEELSNRPGVQLGIVTSKVRDEYENYFHQMFDIAKYFSFAVTASETVKHKPFGDPIVKAMEDSGSKPEESIYVGDTVNDMKAAIDAGTHFAGAIYDSAMPERIKDSEFLLKKPQDLLKVK